MLARIVTSHFTHSECVFDIIKCMLCVLICMGRGVCGRLYVDNEVWPSSLQLVLYRYICTSNFCEYIEYRFDCFMI